MAMGVALLLVEAIRPAGVAPFIYFLSFEGAGDERSHRTCPDPAAPPPATRSRAARGDSPSGFLEEPLIWLAEATGFHELNCSPVDAAIVADHVRAAGPTALSSSPP